MKYYVDIDNTICDTPDTSDYTKAVPIQSRIDYINSLFDNGHFIMYWTARGSRTGKDWSKLTTEQLNSWGCKRHGLVLGKPDYDILIDDKSIHPKDFFDA
jgi:hypothetical protein